MAVEAMIQSKIINRGVLASRLDDLRRAGKKIVFTNGCFDIIHAGHVLYLEEARSHGDILVVGINSDRSVRMIKGPQRPINKENFRTIVVGGLASVDYVSLFDEATPLELIRNVQPDVLVKGQDWAQKGVVGRELVEQRGGKVVLIPLINGLSTTSIVEKTKESTGDREDTHGNQAG